MANKKAKGKRANTRRKFTRKSTKLTVNKILGNVEVGNTVQIVIDSSFHSGMPTKRFHGKTGKVASKRGDCFIVDIKKGKDTAEVITHPVHLKVLNANKGAELK